MNRVVQLLRGLGRRLVSWGIALKPLAAALIQPLLLALVAGLLLPWLLFRADVRAEALKQQGAMELRAVEELHALTKEFVRTRLEYDYEATRCPSELPNKAACLAKPLEALVAFGAKWDEKSGFFKIVLTSYLTHPESSPVVEHLNRAREIVDRSISCIFPQASKGPNTTTCPLTVEEIEQLDAEMQCYSRLLLANARRHTQAKVSSSEEEFCD